MAWRFSGSAADVGVGDELGVRHEEGVDDAQAGGPQRPAGLGDLDHAVGDVGHLGLGGAVGERDLGRRRPCAARARLVSSGYSVAHPQRPAARPGRPAVLDRRVVGHGQDDLDRVGAWPWSTASSPERDDLAPPLLDPVPPGDAEVEEAVGHVDRDLLGPQDPHVVDPGVVDAWPGSRRPRRALHGQVGVREQVEGGLLERALGQDEAEHRRQIFADRAGESGRLRPEPVRSRRAISIAVSAASRPLLVSSGSDRSRAWSTVSVVSTPKTTGTPVSSWTRWMPAAHSPATKS